MNITMKFANLVVLSTMLISTAANAAKPLEAPSDKDLHVAYCLGAEEVVFTEDSADVASTNAATSIKAKRNAKAAQLRLDRLNEYLDRRRPFVQEAEMDVESKRGFADVQFVETSRELHSCTSACAKLRPHYPYLPNGASNAPLLNCIAACDANLPKIWSCASLSWLP